MITDNFNEKVSPKVKAQEVIWNALRVASGGYWIESERGMTTKEVEKIQEQVFKIADRIAKKLGYDKAPRS